MNFRSLHGTSCQGNKHGEHRAVVGLTVNFDSAAGHGETVAYGSQSEAGFCVGGVVPEALRVEAGAFVTDGDAEEALFAPDAYPGTGGLCVFYDVEEEFAGGLEEQDAHIFRERVAGVFTVEVDGEVVFGLHPAGEPGQARGETLFAEDGGAEFGGEVASFVDGLLE